jgi:hypothetical protein
MVSELNLLGADYDNEGKPIAYLGKEAEGQLQFQRFVLRQCLGPLRDYSAKNR